VRRFEWIVHKCGQSNHGETSRSSIARRKCFRSRLKQVLRVINSEVRRGNYVSLLNQVLISPKLSIKLQSKNERKDMNDENIEYCPKST
jgi:hypothetical protein